MRLKYRILLEYYVWRHKRLKAIERKRKINAMVDYLLDAYWKGNNGQIHADQGDEDRCRNIESAFHKIGLKYSITNLFNGEIRYQIEKH